MDGKPEVVVVGMGYVGLTLAVTLAHLGLKVWGYDREVEVVRQLRDGRSPLFEPGVDQILQCQLGHNLVVENHLPTGCSGTIIICVSTPMNSTQSPDLRNLQDAVKNVALCAEDGCLVMVRSTVPIGTCRNQVLPLLRSGSGQVHLAFCPERTIQGRALVEIRELPQVVGGLDDYSTDMGVQFWNQVTRRVIPVSSLEAAEMVKLINNCHTDLIYSYGNEVAMMAQHLGLDPLELINAANLDYPRPDLARPGFVSGPCMSKDPYFLVHSLMDTGYTPQLILGARHINESLPETVAQHFVESLKKRVGTIEDAKVLVCGFAYKGWPETDDVRETAAVPILNVLRRYPLQLYGHDALVPADTIAAFGACPVAEMAQGFDGARGVLFLNESPTYRLLDMTQLVGTMKSPGIVYDCWRMFDSQGVESVAGIRHLGIGYG